MATYRDFLSRLKTPPFAQWFSQQLINSGFAAGFWECPPYSPVTAEMPFECVLIYSDELTRRPADGSEFAAKLSAFDPEDIGVFPNRDGSATLISPQVQNANFAHLLGFLRNASSDQICKLWATVADEILNNTSDTPRWLSTSGLGVPWLHIRLDCLPKYYRYAPYKEATWNND